MRDRRVGRRLWAEGTVYSDLTVEGSEVIDPRTLLEEMEEDPGAGFPHQARSVKGSGSRNSNE